MNPELKILIDRMALRAKEIAIDCVIVFSHNLVQMGFDVEKHDPVSAEEMMEGFLLGKLRENSSSIVSYLADWVHNEYYCWEDAFNLSEEDFEIDDNVSPVTFKFYLLYKTLQNFEDVFEKLKLKREPLTASHYALFDFIIRLFSLEHYALGSVAQFRFYRFKSKESSAEGGRHEKLKPGIKGAIIYYFATNPKATREGALRYFQKFTLNKPLKVDDKYIFYYDP